MTILTRQSLMCLRNLQHLIIAESNLTFIAPGTFGVLKKLKTVSLISNAKLTYIPANIFNLRSLDIINLSIFKNIECSVIDFTQSGILYVDDEAFNESHIDVLYFFKNLFVDKNTLSWDICYLSEYNYFKICKTSALKTLNSVRSLVDIWEPKTLHINDNEITSIDNNAFNNLKITTLIIRSTAENFNLNADSFAGLPNLKVLKLETKPILFTTSFFHHFESLISLEISTTQFSESNNMRTCELLSNITSLQSFSIVHHKLLNKRDFLYEFFNQVEFIQL
ncbi:leucine-rich repeat-containing protein 15-like [Aphidius gifuensis]|uniref:leucine-rich repeat-containing protein 15-like n=1 Tax=Aphidius gifuensis TaxID=684658 RepID=UPI001CDB5731|nr:leucine-rich repeat-containing protein 15-like [Aphidius gifuensis]